LGSDILFSDYCFTGTIRSKRTGLDETQDKTAGEAPPGLPATHARPPRARPPSATGLGSGGVGTVVISASRGPGTRIWRHKYFPHSAHLDHPGKKREKRDRNVAL